MIVCLDFRRESSVFEVIEAPYILSCILHLTSSARQSWALPTASPISHQLVRQFVCFRRSQCFSSIRFHQVLHSCLDHQSDQSGHHLLFFFFDQVRSLSLSSFLPSIKLRRCQVVFVFSDSPFDSNMDDFIFSGWTVEEYQAWLNETVDQAVRKALNDLGRVTSLTMQPASSPTSTIESKDLLTSYIQSESIMAFSAFMQSEDQLLLHIQPEFPMTPPVQPVQHSSPVPSKIHGYLTYNLNRSWHLQHSCNRNTSYYLTYNSNQPWHHQRSIHARCSQNFS